jgi:calcineurin-like phosphoesterase family protein
MTIFFTSDTHFGHYNIINFCKRPIVEGFQGVPPTLSRNEAKQLNDELLIRRWNECIKADDEVYHLGDFAFYGKTKAAEIIQRLNGRKYLIRGNHDGHASQWWLYQGFQWVKDYYVVRVHEQQTIADHLVQYHQNIVLCHFPILSWENMQHGSWHLHGHCHGALNHLNEKTTRYDVGVDPNNWYPLTYDEVKGIMQAKRVTPPEGDYHRPKEDEE